VKSINKIAAGIWSWLNKQTPRNLLIKKPFIGGLVFLVISFGFIVLYKPLQVQGARSFGLALTIAAYCLLQAISVFVVARLFKFIPYFSEESGWTILKELLSIVIFLTVLGIAVYFAGFIIEEPSRRWNLSTFFDSVTRAFLIGIVPFAFFTLVNFRYLFYDEKEKFYKPGSEHTNIVPAEELIRIDSRLKNEEVSFYPDQFLYAESDGNYVVFYLNLDGQKRKKIVRNSISNIEQQLSEIPFLIRIHRAFIVNLKKVSSKKGNTLGYRIKISGTEDEIPVSRQNTKKFDRLIDLYE